MNRLENLFATIAAAAKLIVYMAMIALLIPAALLYKRLDPQHPFKIPRLFHRATVSLLGIRMRISGQISTASPVLFVSNHVSYLDIPILGAILPAAFVAKSEVRSWPVFGFLAELQNTVFIERRAVRAAAQRTQLQDHFAGRQNLILFPEGTSSNGLAALPFKSSLFSIVEESAGDMPITVQPVSVTCTELDGYPLLRDDRDAYAWYGDMTLAPHLWNVFKNGNFTVEVTFHPPLTMADCANRKSLAATCQDMVAKGIEESLSRPAAQEPPLLRQTYSAAQKPQEIVK